VPLIPIISTSQGCTWIAWCAYHPMAFGTKYCVRPITESV
jgi:hypothetical protein